MDDFLSILIAICLLLVGSYIFLTRTPYSRKNASLFVLIAFISICLLAVYGVSYYFTGESINDAVIYHLEYGLSGAGFLEYFWLIVSTVIYLVFCISAIFLLLKYQKGHRTNNVSTCFFAFPLLLLSIIFNPVSLDIFQLLYDKYNSSNGGFRKYYKVPHIERNDRPVKNLVLIYAEGLERTYFDETVFPGLIAGLRELEFNSTYFTNIRHTIGIGWTIAGMVSSQCGIPLATPSDDNAMSSMDTFLPSAVCLGDLLHDEDYYLVFYGGADLNFSGKGKFYKTHGFDEVYGREQLLPKLPDDSYKSWWGLYDDSLFDFAYQKYEALSARKDKFALFLLTLDTHHPNGHPSKSCQHIVYGSGANKILNAVACSDYLITQLVKKIMQSPYAEQTIIVVASDHLAMRNTAYDSLKNQKRRNLLLIIDPANLTSVKIEKPGTTMDMGTTVLPFIGYNGSIGLGHNLLDDTEASRADILHINKNLRNWRSSIEKFWGYPKLEKSISILLKKKMLEIDNRRFKFPALIEFNDDLETVIRFDFTGAKKLLDYLPELNKDTLFLLVDECIDINKLGKDFGEDGFCLVLGKKDLLLERTKLRKNISYAYGYIQELSRTAVTSNMINNK